ncbi:hypothetical protein SLA2020_418160 [Shorea laevis]
MARPAGLSLLILCSLLYMAGMAESADARHSNPTAFIKASCKATRYPALCVHSLSGYASAIRQNERQLARTALSVSLARARSAAAFVAKMAKVRGIKGKEYRVVKDCIENLGDSVDRLSQSIRELGHVGRAVGQDFMWHMSNVPNVGQCCAYRRQTLVLMGFRVGSWMEMLRLLYREGSTMLLKSLVTHLH